MIHFSHIYLHNSMITAILLRQNPELNNLRNSVSRKQLYHICILSLMNIRQWVLEPILQTIYG